MGSFLIGQVLLQVEAVSLVVVIPFPVVTPSRNPSGSGIALN